MKIIVALDRSTTAEQALPPAISLAQSADAELVLLNVFSPQVDMANIEGETPSERVEEARRGRENYLLALGETAPDVHVEVAVEPRRKTEDADECIARVARERGANLVVLASKHASGVAGLVLGSTAQGLLRLSPCPVLIVRPTAA